MTLEEMRDIDVYIELTGTFVNRENNVWTVSSPQEDTTYATDAELVAGIMENLEIMQEVYRENGETCEWNEIVSRCKAGEKWMI